MDPRADARRAKSDWSQRAWRVRDQAPNWVVVMLDDKPGARGRARFVREQLALYGVTADVRSMRGDGTQYRPWKGWCTFARVKQAETEIEREMRRHPNGVLSA